MKNRYSTYILILVIKIIFDKVFKKVILFLRFLEILTSKYYLIKKLIIILLN